MSSKATTTVQQSYLRHLAGRRKGFGSLAGPPREKLSYGDCGTAVTELQDFLRLVGFGIEANGMYDELMVKAITKFQAKVDLTPTGVADEKTQAALEEKARAAFAEGERRAAAAQVAVLPVPTAQLSPIPEHQQAQAVASANAQVSGDGPTSYPLEPGSSSGNGDTGVGYGSSQPGVVYAHEELQRERGSVHPGTAAGTTDANGVVHVDPQKLVLVGQEATPFPSKEPSTLVMIGVGVAAVGLVLWLQSRAKFGPPRPDTSDLKGLVARREAGRRAARRTRKPQKQEA